MARKLPIGIQSFEKIRRDGFVYVDKTAFVYRLAQSGLPYFLSRPRRFGKSLLVSTMRAYFEARRELFEGLDIERLEGDGPGSWVARPVLSLSFNGADYTREGALEDRLDSILRDFEERWGDEYSDRSPADRLRKLIELAHRGCGHRVAVLIDEYDKPILDAMDDPALAETNRTTLKGFYSVLKDLDEHMRFLFVTGVTKFSKVSIFSDLNQLNDISLVSEYATACGITERELTETFGPELDALAQRLGCDHDGCLDALRAQYDGYCFHPLGPGRADEAGSRMVYNPFSLLKAMDEGLLGSYWFATGTPTFLAIRMKDSGLDPRRLTNGTIYASAQRLSDFRANDPDPIPLLYQAGYLTIRAADARTGRYTLAVPNAEVERGLVESLLPVWAPGYAESRGTDVFSLLDHVEAGDTDSMRDVIAALFASIPYTKGSDPFENYFQAVLWLVFDLLGRFVRTESHQARGRVDVTIEASAHVYVMELKRDGTAEEALAQIAEKGYAVPFAADSREVHLVGAAFDSATRQLADWQAVSGAHPFAPCL